MDEAATSHCSKERAFLGWYSDWPPHPGSFDMSSGGDWQANEGPENEMKFKGLFSAPFVVLPVYLGCSQVALARLCPPPGDTIFTFKLS